MKKQGSILRKVGVLLAVALAAGSLTEVATAHLVRFGGSLTVTFQPTNNVFKGRVSSSKDRCEPGRTVVVFRVVDGPDERVGSDRTDSAGRWRLAYNPQSDDYYAKVRSKDIGPGAHRHICKAIKTSTFNIPPRCGNGWIEAGEPCDDGNTVSGDGCDSACQVESPAVCGNNVVEAGEECDDGNTVNGDGCSSSCQVEGLAAQLAAKEPDEGLKAACAARRAAVALKSASRASSAGRLAG
jgi:cysteine-rich repeat protein